MSFDHVRKQIEQFIELLLQIAFRHITHRPGGHIVAHSAGAQTLSGDESLSQHLTP